MRRVRIGILVGRGCRVGWGRLGGGEVFLVVGALPDCFFGMVL